MPPPVRAAHIQAPNRPFVIRDPVHGYVRIAPHERIVVDHPITQRLRNIAQTGLAHLVFPEARTSRFAHSLGAMHLASRFLVGSIEHAAGNTVREFFQQIEELIARSGYAFRPDPDLDLTGPQPFGGGALLAPRARVGADLTLEEQQQRRRLLAFAEASLRLAALFHDLGHLPFSHDFETALREYVSQNQEGVSVELQELAAETPHEEIGHKLAGLVFESLLGGVQPVVRATYGLAKQILDDEPPYYASRRPNAGVLAWLHSLVDGEIDSDRADYLLRDGRALGFEFAAYDLDRLVDNLVLVREPKIGFITAVNEPGVSAVESFFMSRARSSQAMIRHHKVSELSAALQHATVAGLRTEKGGALLRSLETLARGGLNAAAASAFLEDYSRYDDAWWVEVLRSVDAGDDQLLHSCLRAVLARQPTIRSLWKRKGDLDSEDVVKLNAALPVESAVAERLKRDGVLLVAHGFTPYRRWPDSEVSDSIVQVRSDARGLRAAAEYSRLMQALNTAWESDLHVYAFAVTDAAGAEERKKRVLAALLEPKEAAPRKPAVRKNRKPPETPARKAPRTRRKRG